MACWVYRLIHENSGIQLREDERGGHYLVRAANDGQIGARWVCAGGARCEEIVLAPEHFLRTHPDVAEVPGVGAALRELTAPRGDGQTGAAL